MLCLPDGDFADTDLQGAIDPLLSAESGHGEVVELLADSETSGSVAFVGRIVAGAVCGIVDTLKGVDHPESVDLALRCRRGVS